MDCRARPYTLSRETMQGPEGAIYLRCHLEPCWLCLRIGLLLLAVAIVYWLVTITPLKNISQPSNHLAIQRKIEQVQNHQQVVYCEPLFSVGFSGHSPINCSSQSARKGFLAESQSCFLPPRAKPVEATRSYHRWYGCHCVLMWRLLLVDSSSPWSAATSCALHEYVCVHICTRVHMYFKNDTCLCHCHKGSGFRSKGSIGINHFALLTIDDELLSSPSLIILHQLIQIIKHQITITNQSSQTIYRLINHQVSKWICAMLKHVLPPLGCPKRPALQAINGQSGLDLLRAASKPHGQQGLIAWKCLMVGIQTNNQQATLHWFY